MVEPQSNGRVLVVEDDEALRTYLSGLLVDAGFATVAVGTGEEALAVATAADPQAVILDVCLPGVSGYEVCRELRERRDSLPILFISGERVESFDRVAGLLIGADDYLVKPFAPDELIARLRSILRRARRVHRSPHGLTVRELEILRQLAGGLTPSAIAERLVISPKTVGTHIEHIFQKLGVRTRAQAVAAAYLEHLVEADVEAHELTT